MRVVGWLSPIVTLALGSAIWPVIGFLDERPVMVTDPVEVDRAFTVSLTDLLMEGTFLEERWRRAQPRPGADEDGYFPIYFYRVPGRPHLGRDRARRDRTALRRHRRRMARSEEVVAVDLSTRIDVNANPFLGCLFLRRRSPWQK